jgi:hypothetical protein
MFRPDFMPCVSVTFTFHGVVNLIYPCNLQPVNFRIKWRGFGSSARVAERAKRGRGTYIGCLVLQRDDEQLDRAGLATLPSHRAARQAASTSAPLSAAISSSTP